MRRNWMPLGAALFASLAAGSAWAASHPPAAGALNHLRIVTEPGRRVENGTLVWRDGRIVAAGSDAKVPDGIVARDGAGLTVYPGLIELHDVRAAAPAAGGDGKEAASARGNLEIAGDAFALLRDEAANQKLRETGFVLSLVAEKSGLLQGEGLLATLGGGDPGARLLARDVTQNVSLRAAEDGYPASIMGAVAATRQAFSDALWLENALAAFRRQPAQPRPRGSAASAALARAARGAQPVVFEADDALGSLRAAALARELGLTAWIAGSGEEYRRLAEIRAAGLPQIVPLRFPRTPKKPAAGERGAELDSLRHAALAPANPAAVVGTGLPVAFTTFRLEQSDELHAAVAKAVLHGLSADQALAAFTTTPARLLGIDARWGTLATGKSASFILVEGDLFVEKPKIREVWIEGERFVLDSPAEEKSAAKADATAADARGAIIPAIAMEPGVDPTAAWRTAKPERPATVLVRGATVWTSGPQGRLAESDLLIRDGRIAAIGGDLTAPSGTLVLEAQGRHVTPGLIDCHSHTAIAGAVNEGTHNVTAEVRIADVIDSEDVGIYRQLAGGLTAANLLHGSANAIGGQNAVIKLRWGAPPDELRFAGAPSGIKFALGENPKQSNWQPKEPRYPRTRMGVEQLIRERFLAARDYRRSQEESRRPDRESRVPPRTDFQLETIAEILEGKRLVHAHSYRADEIVMLLDLAEAFGFRIATLQHVLEGYKVADEISRHGAGASGFSDWWAYKYEVIDAIPWNGAILHDRGVVTSFNSDSSELARRLNLEAAKAVRYGGLAEDEALRFVTLNPAKQLRIDDRVGSLEVGKDADFVVWSGSPLSTQSVVLETWIDGRKYFDRDADLAARERLERERSARLAALTAGEEKKP